MAGKQNGWIRTAFLKDDVVTAAKLADGAVGAAAFGLDVVQVALTANAEAADAIVVDIIVTDLDGNAVTEAITLECGVYEANMLQSLVADFRLAETGAGAEVSTTAQPRLLITTSTAGLASVTITDVSTAFVGDVYLVVRPLNKLGVSVIETITFA